MCTSHKSERDKNEVYLKGVKEAASYKEEKVWKVYTECQQRTLKFRNLLFIYFFLRIRIRY